MSAKSQARTFALAVGALLLPLQPACKKAPAPAGSPAADPAAARPGSGQPAVVIEGDKAAVPAIPVGMTDPLARLTSPTAKSLQRGYKALNAKNWEECATAFSEVTAALPDYLDARYYTARALLNQAKPAEARQQLEELLKRNYVAYAGRAASGKDWLALRTSPEWEPYKQAEARIKAAYATGLSSGLTLVQRTAAAKPIKYVAVADAAQAKEGLQEAKRTLDRLYGALDRVTPTEGVADPAMTEALADDLNTPRALAVLHELLADLNRSTSPASAGRLRASASLLGLLGEPPARWLRGCDQVSTIMARIAERLSARKARQFARADAIRAELLTEGVILEDRPDGTTDWRRA